MHIMFIKILSFPGCTTSSCRYKFSKNLTTDLFITKSLFTINLKKGYNIISEVYFGNIGRYDLIMINQTRSGRISVDTSGNSLYSDYVFNGTALKRLHPTKNYAFCLNVLIRTKFYYNQQRITKEYPSIGRFDLSIQFTDSPVFTNNRLISLIYSIFFIS